MRPQPYIGVTGFMTRGEVLAILSGMPRGRLLMVGVLASAKTLRGEPNSWPNRFPPTGEICNIFVYDPRALNLIHLATDDPTNLERQLELAINHSSSGFSGSALNGFQLNMVWPDPNKLRAVFERRKLRIVLQIGSTAFRKVDEDAEKLAIKLDDYIGIATDILFDLSGGLGREIDAARALPVLRAVRARHPNLGLGVAGGLSAETIHLIDPIIQEFPDVSIDAEGKIRDDKDARLNLEKTAHYIGKATRAFHDHTLSHTPS